MGSLSPAAWGALIGFLVGVMLLVIPLSKVLLVAFLAFVGYAIGRLIESEELRGRIRELFSLLFH